MQLPELAGATLGQYRVGEPVGAGELGVVYRGVQRKTRQEVAIKVLDPSWVARPNFMRRFVSQTATVSKLRHPGIVPIFEIGTRSELIYLAMQLVHGTSLREVMDGTALEIGSVWRIVRAVGDALHSAHEVGMVHQDLKPSNVLVGSDGSVLVTDFGLARISYGFAVGTPGYMSPEQAMGLEVDRRSDVHALGALTFELLTGSVPYPGGSPVDKMLAVAGAPVPSARDRNPKLPPELDEVLRRAMAKSPDDRPETAMTFLEELSQVPMARHGRLLALSRARSLEDLPKAVVQAADAVRSRGAEGWGADVKLVTFFEASLDPVLAVDEAGMVSHWNSSAEELFGWSRRQVTGTPVMPTLVAPRSREVLERVFATVLAHGATDGGQAVEAVMMHRDGHQIPVELSLSVVKLSQSRAHLVAFCRDISEQKEAERLRAMQDAVAGALGEAAGGEDAAAGVLEAVCANLGWQVGVVWRVIPGREVLRCHHLWTAPSFEGGDFEALTRGAAYEVHRGLPGKVLGAQEPAWHAGLAREAESDRDIAALRAGLESAVAVPIRGAPGVVGVLEFFSTARGEPGDLRVSRLEAVGRRLGRVLWSSPPAPAPAEAADQRAVAPAPSRVRYRIDSRHTRLGFSCAFMKFLTVHGQFGDFSGWVELDGDDPRTATVECRVRTASVDTGSMDRDYHLCSDDFFAVEAFPEMVFRSAGVETYDDDHYRLLGELTIREVTRPIALEVLLEDVQDERSDGRVATLSAWTVISRLDWFLDWEQALEAGRWIVGDQIRLDLEVALVRRPRGR